MARGRNGRPSYAEVGCSSQNRYDEAQTSSICLFLYYYLDPVL